jgi:DNA invertase Pin-like site-specific DNA recombinase
MQIEDIKKFCDFRWPGTAPVFFVDHGESGAKVSRPEFNEMMKLVRAGEFQAIVAWKFDRIGRSSLHLISILDELKVLNVDFISIKEAIDTTTPMGKMIFTIFAALAEFERETIRMRTKAGIELAQSKGIHCGRPSEISIETVKDIIYLRDQKMTIDEIHSVHPQVSRATIGRIVKKETV